ncbi:Bgt-4854 [Blumeria graminis f. sp. tritici]|uniref:Bgt-4854 n=3 Tax=Blumeria graminis TaxID=34373 RepID=A0A9X9MNB3_BLUGR|nr:hypothetical protein BGT96224_4854 [Blumeria graminis f. sp. tritici 96224]VDB93929.1 Bgt-4854 [Blumeria graminis f. sp. tritici]
MRKVLEIRKERESNFKRDSRSRIKPSTILRSTLPGGLLLREYGFTPIDTPRVLAAGLQPYGSFNLEKGRVKSINEGCSLFDIVPYLSTTTPSNIVAVNLGNEVSTSIMSSRDISSTCGRDGLDFAGPDASLEIRERKAVYFFHSTSLPTSISINERQERVISTSFGSGSSGIHVFITYFQEESNTRSFSEEHIILDKPLDGPIDFFCSVSAPSNSNLFFAVGTSQGVFSISSMPSRVYPTRYRLCDTTTVVSKICHQKDVFAVEFLKECPDLLLSGGRPGKLFLSDLRDSSTRYLMKHPSSITHIKSVDSNHIVVAGLESSLCQYDLRFLKDTEVSATSDSNQTLVANSSISSSSPKKHSTISTQPIVTYHGYHNDATTGLGFDLDLDSRIIAAAQEVHEGHKPVQLFSLRDGSALHSPCENLVSDSKKSCGNLVRSIRFAQEANTPTKSLFIGSGGIVQKYQ